MLTEDANTLHMDATKRMLPQHQIKKEDPEVIPGEKPKPRGKNK